MSSPKGSPTDSGTHKDGIPNCWFKPETDAPSSIRSIQIEERAMKDLRRQVGETQHQQPSVDWNL